MGTVPLVAAQGNQFGGQDRADAAQNMILLAVQQAISALPPMAGQEFAYQYDPNSDTYQRRSTLGPSVLRSTRPIGRGRFNLRLTASHFRLSQSLGPAVYQVQPRDPQQATPSGFTAFGLSADAKVGVLNFGGSYGVTHWLDVFVAVPATIVDAQARQTFVTRADALSEPPGSAPVSGASTEAAMKDLLDSGVLVYRRESFEDLGFAFNDGTRLGVGRIDLGTRAVVYAAERWRLALAPEMLLPSPSVDEFAGSDSLAVLPRLLGELAPAEQIRLMADLGYEYDFSRSELRRFVGSGGLLLSTRRYSVDIGVSGSVYDRPLIWTPSVAYGRATGTFPATILTTRDSIALGDDYVDFIAGFKVAITPVGS
jgi:hypothetical protein